MDVIRGLDHIPPELQNSIVTIGNFDGVHLGHQYIFQKVISAASTGGCRSLIITFDPHPKMILHPDIQPFHLITTVGEKIALLETIGLDAMLLIPFTLDFAATTAGDFVREILWEKLRITKIFIGHDYTFGKGKEGNEKFLTAIGRSLGFSIEAIPPFQIEGQLISSTRIRHVILDGDVKLAKKFLGRPYSLKGTVAKGYHRGTGLGFPTANVESEKSLMPSRGVYAARINLGGSLHRGALNIGLNPTFGNDRLTIEVFVMGFEGDLYGQTVEILFEEKIRGEVKFDSPDQLAAQIKQDVKRAGEILDPLFNK
ncbi:MAG: bifunctional riboflavin kinase/FAD synthetase [Syntrophales bacterium]|jgi:riboflavin kinase/FMN adenylyltransferase